MNAVGEAQEPLDEAVADEVERRILASKLSPNVFAEVYYTTPSCPNEMKSLVVPMYPDAPDSTNYKVSFTASEEMNITQINLQCVRGDKQHTAINGASVWLDQGSTLNLNYNIAGSIA